MKVTKEVSLSEFEFWGSAKINREHLTTKELDTIEDCISEDDTQWSETEVNDFISFDEEIWLEWIGVSQEEWDARFREEAE